MSKANFLVYIPEEAEQSLKQSRNVYFDLGFVFLVSASMKVVYAGRKSHKELVAEALQAKLVDEPFRVCGGGELLFASGISLFARGSSGTYGWPSRAEIAPVLEWFVATKHPELQLKLDDMWH